MLSTLPIARLQRLPETPASLWLSKGVILMIFVMSRVTSLETKDLRPMPGPCLPNSRSPQTRFPNRALS